MALYPGTLVGGGTIEYGAQATLSTETGAYKFRRVKTIDSFPDKQKDRVPQEVLGHELHSDFTDTGILIERVQEEGLGLTMDCRTGSGSSVEPAIITDLKSGGWSAIAGSTVTTILTYTDAGNIALTDDVFGSDYEGAFILVELNSGAFYPALVYDYTLSGNGCLLSMDLPSASQVAKTVKIMHTAVPQVREVPATSLLTFRQKTRGTHTGTNDLSFTAIGCALSKIGDLVLDFSNPGSTLTFPMTYHVTDVKDVGSDSLGSETMNDSEAINPLQGCEVAVATWTGSNLSSTLLNVEKIEIGIPYHTVPKPAEGDSSSVLNSVESYFSNIPSGDDGRVMVKITKKWAKADLDRFLNQTETYFHVNKSTTAAGTPAWAIAVPRLEPVEHKVLKETEDWMRTELELRSITPYWAATHGNTEFGDMPIFIGISEVW